MSNDSVFSFFFVTLFTCLVAAIAHNDHIFLPSHLLEEDSLSCVATDSKLNYRPVIGILSQPGDGASGRLSNATGVSNIPASYVKFVESGGARVIPLLYNESPETVAAKLGLVNGLLIPGGSTTSGPYLEVLQFLFQAALERNDAGDHFPVLGLNLGGNLLIKIVADQADVLEIFNASSLPSSLQLWASSNDEGSLYQRFPQDLLTLLSTECLVLHNHKYAITPRRLQYNKQLSNFFKILALSADRDGKVFVSTALGRNYPVTVNLWQPEKNAFEWATSLKAPHTENAIRVTQSSANFFVSEARKSSNKPDAQKVLDNLIYNYKPTYGGYAGKGYDQVYLFE